jgi:Ca2+-binding RTX toxin-like protein
LGLSGADTIAGAGSADLLDGGAGNDRLSGRGGNDVLMGQAGHDALSGGAGSDRLIGGSGDDVLTGGTGADVFSFRSAFGFDQVTDFQDGLDRIDLTFLREMNGGALVTMADLLVKNAKSGATIQLDLDGDRKADLLDLDGDGQVDSVTILLSGISARPVDAGDFLF